MAQNHNTVRQSIVAIANRSHSQQDEESLIDFVARECYSRLSPSNEHPGDVYEWFTEHGYSASQVRSWLFEGGTRNRIPTRVYSYAELIKFAMIDPDGDACCCVELAHSKRAAGEAEKRCPEWHLLTRENLDRYAASADERVRAQYAKGESKRKKANEPDPTAEAIQKAIQWHSDPLNFVRRAVHGNGPRISANRGHSDFGHSMLCAVLETPQWSQLRLKPWKNEKGKLTYRLYDTRTGIVGNWDWHVVVCRACQQSVTDPSYSPCLHALTWVTKSHDEKPENTKSMEFAVCGECSENSEQRTIWLWDNRQKTCPACGTKRGRRKTIEVAGLDLPGPYKENNDDE